METKVVNRKEFKAVLPKIEKGIFVNGNTGVGKTVIIKDHIGKLPRSINRISDALDEKGNYNPDSLWKKEQRMIASETSYIIDDLGNEDDRHAKAIGRIIEDRHSVFHESKGKFKTIITTNMTLEEIVQRYGEGNLRRIAEMCECFTLSDTCMTV